MRNLLLLLFIISDSVEQRIRHTELEMHFAPWFLRLPNASSSLRVSRCLRWQCLTLQTIFDAAIPAPAPAAQPFLWNLSASFAPTIHLMENGLCLYRDCYSEVFRVAEVKYMQSTLGNGRTCDCFRGSHTWKHWFKSVDSELISCVNQLCSNLVAAQAKETRIPFRRKHCMLRTQMMLLWVVRWVQKRRRNGKIWAKKMKTFSVAFNYTDNRNVNMNGVYH